MGARTVCCFSYKGNLRDYLVSSVIRLCLPTSKTKRYLWTEGRRAGATVFAALLARRESTPTGVVPLVLSVASCEFDGYHA